MSDLTRAIGYLEQGDWDAAHRIVQEDPSKLASWAHGIVHFMEGDLPNARYWYGLCERDLNESAIVVDEIAALKSALASSTQETR